MPSTYNTSTGVTDCRPTTCSSIFSSGARNRRRTREVFVRTLSTKESRAPFTSGSFSGSDTERFSSVPAGQVRNERACDYVLRPLTQNEALRAAPDMDAAFDLMLKGGLYSLVVQSRDTADQVIFDLIDGSVALFFPGKAQVLTLSAGTESCMNSVMQECLDLIRRQKYRLVAYRF